MRTCSHISSTAILILVFTVGITQFVGAAVLINNFNSNGMEGYYGSWSGADTEEATYLDIGASATESGGSYDNIAAIFVDPATYELRITARLGGGNIANHFNVLLHDADENFGYQFNTSALNTSTFTTLTRSLDSWTFRGAGSGSPTFDTTGIDQYSLQGDYSSSDALRIQFDNLDLEVEGGGGPGGAVPEPTTAGLVGMGIVLIACCRRKISHGK
ncbi:MAG: PEP-CTERM sorting domain-containing protein [Verrucomicrobia bacterium]|nr:PEP-CTERM sorting domain-containing protein [Verrucomicrobiota bacterium]